jgi:hypothetical protein
MRKRIPRKAAKPHRGKAIILQNNLTPFSVFLAQKFLMIVKLRSGFD